MFHVDAGWNSQIAVNNIEKLVDGLGLDLYTEVIDWEEMRDLQLAFFKSGVPHIDTPQDHAFFATMYKFAEQHRVRYILTGANLSTECIRNPIEWMYYQSDSVQLRDIHRRFGTRPLRSFPITSILRHKVYLPYIRRIRVVRPLNYVPYVKEDAMRLLQEKFGWQPYPQKHFESRFTRFYESYWLPKKFGYDTRRVQYSSLILTKQMTREEALEKLVATGIRRSARSRMTSSSSRRSSASRVDELLGYLRATQQDVPRLPVSGEHLRVRREGHAPRRVGSGREAVIAIVHYGVGNVGAIANIYKKLGIAVTLATSAAELNAAARIILPGVGAFDWAMGRLNDSGMREALERAVQVDKKPLLGICVGMQMLALRSDEGKLAGLGWIDGEVKRFDVGSVDAASAHGLERRRAQRRGTACSATSRPERASISCIRTTFGPPARSTCSR